MSWVLLLLLAGSAGPSAAIQAGDHRPSSLARAAAGDERPDLAREDSIASHVSLPTALATVRELVTLGARTGGTASGDRAAALVSGRLRELGLSVEIVEDPPMRTHEETRWRVALGERVLASAWPYNFSPSIGPVAARLVPGSDQGPESADSVKGSVVFVEGKIDPKRYARLANEGALALVTDTPGDPNHYLDSALIEAVPEGAAGDRTIPVFGLSYREGRLLHDALAAGSSGPGGGAPSVTVELASTIGEGRPRTVVATLAGAGACKGEILILCAHGDSDSGGPGADDNASGVASLIEVARALSAAGAGGLLPGCRPTVRFVVWGAEYHSSHAYVVDHKAELSRTKAVINYDETGTGAERDAVYYEGNDVPWNEPLLRTIESVANDHAGVSGFPTAWTSNPTLGGTDAYAFLPKKYHGLDFTTEKIPATTVFTAAWGTPAIMKQTPGWRSKGWPGGDDLFIDFSAYYHSGGDTPANTTDAEPWNMERCAKLVAVSLYRLMAETRPAGQAPPSSPPHR